MEKELAIPSVHLNGTSQEVLLEQYKSALVAITNAQEFLNQAAPHARDYYVQSRKGNPFYNAYYKARDQHLARLNALNIIYKELEVIAIAVQDGGYKKEPPQ